jgi:hypothetical protein
MGELPKFLVFSSGTECERNSHIFAFPYCVHLTPDFCIYVSEVIHLGLVALSWSYFQMNKDNYPHFTLAEDGRLVSIGQHRPGFP